MASSLGTAYIQVRGDLSSLNKQLVANFHPSKLGKLGKGAGLAIGAGLGAGLAGVTAGKALFDVGKRFDEQFDKIRVGTGQTGRTLKGLESDFKAVLRDTPSSMEDVGTAVSQLNRRLGLTGKPLQDFTKQITTLSRITETDLSTNIESVARAFEDWDVPVKDQSKALDGLFRLGQKSGISVSKLADSIQKFGSPLRILGFSLGEAAATFATFERAGVNTQTMVPGLKLAIANLIKPSKDLETSMKELGISAGKPEEGLKKVFALLGNKSNLTNAEKTSLAMEVFGKRAGADMAEAVRQGRFEVDELMKAFGKGDSIRKAGRDTEDFGEKWKRLKNTVLVAIEPTATKFFDSISKDMERVGKIISDPKLSTEEKWDRIGVVLSSRLESGIEIAAGVAERLAPKVAGAFARGFINAPKLVQLVAGAWLFTKARKLLLGFGLLGKQAGAAFSTGAASTAVLPPLAGGAGAVAGTAGAAAGGGAAAQHTRGLKQVFGPEARSGAPVSQLGPATTGAGLAGVASKLKGFVKTAGFVGVGIAAADAILGSMSDRMGEGSDDLNERLKNLGKTSVGEDLKRRFSSVGEFFKGSQDNDETKRADRLKSILDEVAKSHVGITTATRDEGRELARNLDLTKQQRDEINKTLRAGREKAPIPVSATGAITDFTKGLASGKRDVSRVVTDLLSGLDGLDVSAQRKASRFALGWAKGLRETGQLSRREFRLIKNIIDTNVGDIGGVSMSGPRKLLRSMGLTFDQMVEAVQHPTSQMGRIVADALEALGEGQKASNIRTRVVANSLQRSGKGPAAKMIRQPRAKGGFLSGAGLKDTVPIMAAPGEAVLNRHQQAPVETALRQTYGYGLGDLFKRERKPHYFAQGGFIPRERRGKTGAQGIVPIPGQPGESIHQSILADVEALIKRYKLKITDGYAPSGHAAGGEHPKGLAIDAVPGAGGSWDLVDKLAKWAEPKQGSPRSPFRWVGYTGDSGHGRGNHLHLSWGGGGGDIKAVDIPKLPKFEVTGRKTAMKDLAEAGVKQVRRAAQKVLDRAAESGVGAPVGTSSDPRGRGGSPQANRRLGRSLMRGFFSDKEWPALAQLWQGESGWDEGAVNPSSGAGGIPQALPASKMGKGWQGNARQQIAWGLKYIKQRYGTPSKALAAWKSRSPHWYAEGGFVEFAARGRRPRGRRLLPDVIGRVPRKRRTPRPAARSQGRKLLPDVRAPHITVPSSPGEQRRRPQQPGQRTPPKHRIPSVRDQKRGDRIARQQERKRARDRSKITGAYAETHGGESEFATIKKTQRPNFLERLVSGKGVQVGPVRLFDYSGGEGLYKKFVKTPAGQAAMALGPGGAGRQAERLLTLSKNPRYARLFTAKQKAALETYVRGAEGFQPKGVAGFGPDLNRALRTGDKVSPGVLKHLDTAFVKKLPAKRTFFRGVQPRGLGAKQFDALKKGDVFTDPGFGSTTTRREGARVFGGGAASVNPQLRRYKIEADRGTPYVGIGGLEDEILLQRGRRYKVLDRRKVKDGEQITLKLLNDVDAFAKGGILRRTALALVGEQGPELAKLPDGKHALLGREGPEVRELPVRTRVFSHPETKRIAKESGIQAFAKGGVVKPWRKPDEDDEETELRKDRVRPVKAMAQGGFVDAIQAFAAGGDVQAAKKTKRPKGLKAPPKRLADYLKKKLTAKKRKPKKDRGDGFDLKQLDFWDKAIDTTIPTIQEQISNVETSFDLASPEHFPDERTIKRLQAAGHNIETIKDGTSKSFIDWSAVTESKNFLGQILGQSFRLIGLPFGAKDRGVMEILKDAIQPIQTSIEAIIKRLNTEANEIRAQVRENLRKLHKNEKRVETLDGKIDKEQGKKKPDRRKIKEWREEKGEATEQNKALRKQNRSLTGESDPGGDLAGIEKGRLGDVQVRLKAADTALEDFKGDRETLVGQSGVGGEFASVKTSIAQRVKDLGEISTERIREAVAPIGPDPSERDEEIKRFAAAFANISREFGPNFRSLPRFQRGGMVPGFGEGDRVLAALEPKEGIINKRAVMALGGPAAIERINKIVPRFQQGGVVASPIQVTAPRGQQQMVVVKQDEPKTERQLVEQHLHFVSPPEEQYGVQKNALAELQNSL